MAGALYAYALFLGWENRVIHEIKSLTNSFMNKKISKDSISFFFNDLILKVS